MSGSTSTAAKRWSPATTRGQLLRFVLVNGTNTAVSTAAFYALTFVLSPRLAFTIVYVVGLTFVVLVTPRYVFGARAPWSRRLLLAAWYVCTYLIGLGIVSVLNDLFTAPRLVVVLGTVAVTAPLSFLGARILVGGGQRVSA
jgi:putative flippase GtrA